MNVACGYAHLAIEGIHSTNPGKLARGQAVGQSNLMRMVATGKQNGVERDDSLLCTSMLFLFLSQFLLLQSI